MREARRWQPEWRTERRDIRAIFHMLFRAMCFILFVIRHVLLSGRGQTLVEGWTVNNVEQCCGEISFRTRDGYLLIRAFRFIVIVVR